MSHVRAKYDFRTYRLLATMLYFQFHNDSWQAGCMTKTQPIFLIESCDEHLFILSSLWIRFSVNEHGTISTAYDMESIEFTNVNFVLDPRVWDELSQISRHIRNAECAWGSLAKTLRKVMKRSKNNER